MTPEIFAPGIISREDRYEYVLTFSPDLEECVFGVTDRFWSSFTLMYTRMRDDGSWTDPIAAPFQGHGDGLLPAFTHDGKTIFFISMRPNYPPSNIWYAVRNDRGWNEPEMVPIPVSTDADEFGLSLTSHDRLFFTSNRPGSLGEHDIYSASAINGRYLSIDNVGSPINTRHNEASPCIAPDESYLIFESNRPGGFGEVDLYVSFFENDQWTEPKNLGPGINTSQIDDAAYVSPDGKFLFFNRRENWVTDVTTDIYWVDIRIVFPDSTRSSTPGDAHPGKHRR